MTDTAIIPTKQESLFRYSQTYATFIGNKYYESNEKFILEAEKFGITRRIPFRMAQGMEFGDRVIFLRYGGKVSKTVLAFAEMKISSITFEGDIASEIGEQLVKDGKAKVNDSGAEMCVERGCGSFMIAGGYDVECSLHEIMDSAVELLKKRNEGLSDEEKEKLFVMIGGKLSKVYTEPVLMIPAPKFTRSFIKFESNPTFEYDDTEPEYAPEIVGIRDYRKKDTRTGKKRGRPKKQAKLPLLPGN